MKTPPAVYFIKAATLGHIKIGKADCVLTRFRNLRNVSPDTLILLGEIAGGAATG